MLPALAAALLLAAAPKSGAKPPKAAPPPPAEPAPKAAPAAAPDVDAPSVLHTPIRETEFGKDFTLTAEMDDPSGIYQPLVFWRLAGETSFIQVPLSKQSGAQYGVTIPGPKLIADFEYFVEAYDTQGNGPTRVGSPERPILVRVPNAMAVATAAVAPSEPASPGGGLALGPLITTGAGAALLAVGAILYLGATSAVDEIDAKYGAGVGRLPADAEETRAAQSRGQLGSALMIGGSLAAAGGAVWWLLPGPSAGGGAALRVILRF